ncbi:MAG: Uma2 family endonuclease [Spirochaetes bacterium]|nr:MAG: Uma2 family endonuclease [Spirochaetota bacterium]
MGEPALKKDRIYTYGDYKTWPEDERWELIDGVAWNMSPAPGRFHQEYLMGFIAQILPFLEGNPCKVYTAPFDVLLPDHLELEDDEVTTVVQPDISVICDKSKLTEKGCTGAPDWIIEILSPFTSRKDMSIKYELYQRHGVREYWIVDPGNKYVHVYLLDERGSYPEDPKIYLRDAVIECTVLEGLQIDLKRVFTGE